jgi:hypothetical protein
LTIIKVNKLHRLFDKTTYNSAANVSIVGIMLTPWRCFDTIRGRQWRTPSLRKGLEGFSHGVAGAGARERGAPQSPVFCGYSRKKCAQLHIIHYYC